MTNFDRDVARAIGLDRGDILPDGRGDKLPQATSRVFYEK
jgi:hypothetical protein